jgi:hypothetical protein
MKRLFVLLTLCAVAQLGTAQELLPRKEALKYAFVICADLKNIQGTPIPTDVDLKHPVAVRDGDYGGLVLPESKLSADAIAKAGDQVLPVGQIWLYHLTPVKDGDAVSESKLRMVELEAEGNSATVVQCALGVKSDGSGGLQLLVYGKDKSPVVTVPLKKKDSEQKEPIGVSAERTDDAGKITLRILGKFEATFSVTELSV